MSLLDVIGLVVVLMALLCRRHEARICRRIPENSYMGKSFDAAQVSQRIRRVRGNYLQVVCARSRDRSRQKQLHAQICRTLRCRSYFRRDTTDKPQPLASEGEKRLA